MTLTQTLNRTAVALVAFAAASAPVLAETSFTMNFDGIPKANTTTEPKLEGVAEVLGYYNGDPGSAQGFPRAGSQPWGVTFATSALAINSAAAGGPGNFPTAHSGGSAAGTLGDSVRFGLSTGLALSALDFWYDTLIVPNAPSLLLFSDDVQVFSDKLAFCNPPVEGVFCGWTQYVLAQSVLDKLAAAGKQVTSVAFLAQRNSAVFDDVFLSTTSQIQPIPEPSSIALTALGLALAAGMARRRGS